MRQNFGVDGNTVHFFNNHFVGVESRVAYRSGAAYGAKSRGWSGTVDITDTVNADEVVQTDEDALEFFD